MPKFLFAVAAAAALVAVAPRQASSQIVVQYGTPMYAEPTYSFGYSSYYSPGYSSFSYSPYSYGYNPSYSYAQSSVPYSYGSYTPSQVYYQTAPSYYVSPSYRGGSPTYGGRGWMRPSPRRWR